MLDLDTQELLSGLVDGQLSPAESERARQLLADDASCRQYYEELVALRESLKTLARVSAPAGLADGVRERLHGTLPRPAGVAGADGAAGEALDGRPMRVHGSRARWICLAACLSSGTCANAWRVSRSRGETGHCRNRVLPSV